MEFKLKELANKGEEPIIHSMHFVAKSRQSMIMITLR